MHLCRQMYETKAGGRQSSRVLGRQTRYQGQVGGRCSRMRCPNQHALLGASRCALSDEQVETSMREAWEHEDSKDEMNIVLQGLEQHFCKGTEAGWMGCNDFPGETWAGDGSANKGVMGAGSVCFQRPGQNLVVRVGREEEGVSSLRPELAAIARTLQATSLEVDLLYLCDSEAALNKVSRWIGSGPRTTLPGDANADIMT